MKRRSVIKSLVVLPVVALVGAACKPRSCPPCSPPIPEEPKERYYAIMKDFGRYMEEVEIPHLRRMAKIYDDFDKKIKRINVLG